MAVFKRT